MSEAAAFRSLYRQLLHVSKRLPNASKRPAALAQIRDSFRTHTVELAANPIGNDEERTTRIDKLAAEAESRLGFLKMMTPRSSHRGLLGGSSTFFYHKGEKIDATQGTKGMGRAVRSSLRHQWFLNSLTTLSVATQWFLDMPNPSPGCETAQSLFAL